MAKIIKGCPFCGGEAKVIYMGPEITKQDDRWWVECTCCHAKAKREFSEEKAIDLWNMRIK